MKFVTGNKNKFLEAKAVLSSLEQIDIDLPEIQEVDVKKVVLDKVHCAYEQVREAVVVEDVSLVIDSWNGFPGALVKWAIKSMGLEKFSSLTNYEPVTIHCALAYYDGTITEVFMSSLKGRIVSSRGSNGFGFDSIVEIDGKTLAERTKEEKQEISMRAEVFRQLKEFLKN